jgi:hypothetical protein
MKSLIVSKQELPPERLGHCSFGNDPKNPNACGRLQKR